MWFIASQASRSFLPSATITNVNRDGRKMIECARDALSHSVNINDANFHWSLASSLSHREASCAIDIRMRSPLPKRRRVHMHACIHACMRLLVTCICATLHGVVARTCSIPITNTFTDKKRQSVPSRRDRLFHEFVTRKREWEFAANCVVFKTHSPACTSCAGVIYLFIIPYSLYIVRYRSKLATHNAAVSTIASEKCVTKYTCRCLCHQIVRFWVF